MRLHARHDITIPRGAGGKVMAACANPVVFGVVLGLLVFAQETADYADGSAAVAFTAVDIIGAGLRSVGGVVLVGIFVVVGVLLGVLRAFLRRVAVIGYLAGFLLGVFLGSFGAALGNLGVDHFAGVGHVVLVGVVGGSCLGAGLGRAFGGGGLVVGLFRHSNCVPPAAGSGCGNRPNVQTWTYRGLQIASVALPADHRRVWVADVAGNLASAESSGEWARYLLGELVALPDHAWVFRWHQRRERER